MALPRRFAASVALGVASAIAACSPSGDHYTPLGWGGTGGGHGGSGGSGTGDTTSTTSTASTGSTAGTGGAPAWVDVDGGPPLDSACASAVTQAKLAPLDLYVMLDQSSSMMEHVSGGGSKWAAVSSALVGFATQPGLTGVSLGLQVFPLPNGCPVPGPCLSDAECAAGCGPCLGADPANHVVGNCAWSVPVNDSCSALDYAHPEVEITALPGAAASIKASLAKHAPAGSTPTSAALQGAVDHAHAWAAAHPGDIVAVLLATDGEPSECDVFLADIEKIAAGGATASPSVKTFVIGVGDSLDALDALNAIAAAGGTEQAVLVDTAKDVSAQILAALAAIRSVTSCTFALPPAPSGSTLDYAAVNVAFAPAGGGAVKVFPHVADPAHCPTNSPGWSYDDAQHPQQIVLCPATCHHLGVYGAGQVEVVVGCQTIVN
jgi:hypothetical protein